MRIPDLSTIPDQGPVAEGEYSLKITKAKDNKSDRTGREGLLFVVNVQGEPEAESIFHTLWFPFEHEDADKQQTMWRMVKEFIEAIGMDSSAEPEAQDFQGVEFEALLGLEEDNNGRPRNVIKRVI